MAELGWGTRRLKDCITDTNMLLYIKYPYLIKMYLLKISLHCQGDLIISVLYFHRIIKFMVKYEKLWRNELSLWGSFGLGKSHFGRSCWNCKLREGPTLVPGQELCFQGPEDRLGLLPDAGNVLIILVARSGSLLPATHLQLTVDTGKGLSSGGGSLVRQE